MRKSTSRRALRRSCDWIRDHWNATNLDVPQQFIQEWIYESSDEVENPTGFHLGVFTFGYLQHQLISSDAKDGDMRSVPSKLLFDLFHQWQMKLALAEIHHVTDVRLRPLALFEFPPDEIVQCWREPCRASEPPVEGVSRCTRRNAPRSSNISSRATQNATLGFREWLENRLQADRADAEKELRTLTEILNSPVDADGP